MNRRIASAPATVKPAIGRSNDSHRSYRHTSGFTLKNESFAQVTFEHFAILEILSAESATTTEESKNLDDQCSLGHQLAEYEPRQSQKLICQRKFREIGKPHVKGFPLLRITSTCRNS